MLFTNKPTELAPDTPVALCRSGARSFTAARAAAKHAVPPSKFAVG